MPMDFKIIKERRAILGLTQQDLSDYTGLSLRFIKSVEAGKGNPSIKSLDKIASVLGLEIVIKVKENNVVTNYYDNNKAIIINYNNYDVVVNNVAVKALSYEVIDYEK